MAEIIAFCGLDCAQCPALIAKKNNDRELRKKTAQEWSKMFSHDFKPDDINCDGCIVIKGQHIEYCAMCEIRKCGIDKKIKNCAYCDEYICEKLNKWFENVPNAKNILDEIRQTIKK